MVMKIHTLSANNWYMKIIGNLHYAKKSKVLYFILVSCGQTAFFLLCLGREKKANTKEKQSAIFHLSLAWPDCFFSFVFG